MRHSHGTEKNIYKKRLIYKYECSIYIKSILIYIYIYIYMMEQDFLQNHKFDLKHINFHRNLYVFQADNYISNYQILFDKK